MTHEEILENSLIKLMWSWAFWGRLISRAHVSVCDSSECATACTDGRRYIKVCGEFLEHISFHETVVLLCHEIMHIVLHQTRGVPDGVNPELWNIAEDITINDMILAQFVRGENQTGSSKNLQLDMNSEFFQSGLWTDEKHEISMQFANPASKKIDGVVVKDVHKKTTQQIYDEILRSVPQNVSGEGASGSGTAVIKLKGETTDDHSELNKQKNQKSMSEEEKAEADNERKKWESAVLTEVANAVKNKGTVPAGFEHLVEAIKEPKISWREMLRNALTSTIITDSSYRKFNKRSIVLGTPMPGYTKDGLSVMVHIDTSGSTSGLLPAFLGEICGIMRQHPGSKVTVIQCDCEIQKVSELDSEKGLTEEPVAGFGGTSHQPVINYVNNLEESKKPKILISFTDGYSDIQEAYKSLRGGITSIFVMPKDGYTSAAEGIGQCIVMEDEKC